jgi:hypothetical protein
VFTKEGFDQLPPNHPWDHAIELKPGSKPLDCKIYHLNPMEQMQLNSFLDENLSTGCIHLSKSSMASPFFFIKKKDSSLHPVQDYCKLNTMTIHNAYPIPPIPLMIDSLIKAKYYMKLNIHWGYNNIHIKEGDQWKATFWTP